MTLVYSQNSVSSWLYIILTFNFTALFLDIFNHSSSFLFSSLGISHNLPVTVLVSSSIFSQMIYSRLELGDWVHPCHVFYTPSFVLSCRLIYLQLESYVWVIYLTSLCTPFYCTQEPYFHCLYMTFLPFSKLPWFFIIKQHWNNYGFVHFKSCDFQRLMLKFWFILATNMARLIVFSLSYSKEMFCSRWLKFYNYFFPDRLISKRTPLFFTFHLILKLKSWQILLTICIPNWSFCFYLHTRLHHLCIAANTFILCLKIFHFLSGEVLGICTILYNSLVCMNCIVFFPLIYKIWFYFISSQNCIQYQLHCFKK